jgi:ABC-2 type transport system ATP-binding protein
MTVLAMPDHVDSRRATCGASSYATVSVERNAPRGTGLEVSHLTKSYGTTVALDDLSFCVETGEILGLIGPNGAGKSTAMMIVAGVRRADTGTVTIAGHPGGQGNAEVQTMLGLVPQDLAIYPDLTARENLEFFGEIYRVGQAELARRVERVLVLIGLEQHADQYARSFSGGMKRRLNFGVALIHEPRFVILDEPTVGVDPQSRSHILDCVRELASRGVGVIYASHYMEEVEAVCQKVAIIDQGKLLAHGKLDQLIDRNRTDLFLRVAAPPAELERVLDGRACLTTADGDASRVTIRNDVRTFSASVAEHLASIVDLLADAHLEILSIETQKHSLERLFLELTGRKLRD